MNAKPKNQTGNVHMSVRVCPVSSSASVLQARLKTLGFFGFSIIDDNHNRCLATHLLFRDRGSEHRAKRVSQETFLAPQFLLTLRSHWDWRPCTDRKSRVEIKKKCWGTGPAPLLLREAKSSIFNVIHEPIQCTERPECFLTRCQNIRLAEKHTC